MRSQLPAKRQAVLPRQHEIQDDQAHRLCAQRLPHRLAVGHGMRIETVLAQVLLQQGLDIFIIIDNQDAISHGCSYTSDRNQLGEVLSLTVTLAAARTFRYIRAGGMTYSCRSRAKPSQSSRNLPDEQHPPFPAGG